MRYYEFVERKTATAATKTDAAMPAGASVRIGDDFHGWLLEQASALRNRRHLALDYENLAEELDAIAAAERRELLRRLTTLLGHLLKLRYQPRPRSERSRVLTVLRSRTEVNRMLRQSPGLKGQLERLIAEAYSDARRETRIELGLARSEWNKLFPEQCPWSADLILHEDFLNPAE
jgi:hypothetical protein